jgi:Holliday junction resolvase RusA-like endonuclease
MSFVTIELTFLIKRPISHFVNGNWSNGLRELYQHTRPTTQGDINNYVKFFLDAIDGIFFGSIEMVCLSRQQSYTATKAMVAASTTSVHML